MTPCHPLPVPWKFQEYSDWSVKHQHGPRARVCSTHISCPPPICFFWHGPCTLVTFTSACLWTWAVLTGHVHRWKKMPMFPNRVHSPWTWAVFYGYCVLSVTMAFCRPVSAAVVHLWVKREISSAAWRELPWDTHVKCPYNLWEARLWHDTVDSCQQCVAVIRRSYWSRLYQAAQSNDKLQIFAVNCLSHYPLSVIAVVKLAGVCETQFCF